MKHVLTMGLLTLTFSTPCLGIEITPREFKGFLQVLGSGFKHGTGTLTRTPIPGQPPQIRVRHIFAGIGTRWNLQKAITILN